MATENPSMLHHVSVVASDLEKSLLFYDALFAVIGGKRILSEEGAVAFGKQFPEFWVHPAPYDGGKAGHANGVHFAFFASSAAEVDRFHAVAVSSGGTDDGPPGARPDYGEPYYGGFVRDPDGYKLEAVFWNEDSEEEAQ